MIREDVDVLVEEIRLVGLRAAMLSDDWPEARRLAIDAVDTAQALPPADQEAAAALRAIARMLSAQGWKMAERRVGYKGGSALKTKLGNPKIRTAVLVGLRGRG